MDLKFPLDDDGFLRRQCPACEKDFKWRNAAPGEGEPTPASGYFCPYCGHQAATDQWWTHDQIAFIRANAMGLISKELAKPLKDMERLNRPGGMFRVKVSLPSPPRPIPLAEHNDLTRHSPACHPREPVKVAPERLRNSRVHCLVCGAENMLSV